MFYCIEGKFDIEFDDWLTHLCEVDCIIIPKGTASSGLQIPSEVPSDRSGRNIG